MWPADGCEKLRLERTCAAQSLRHIVAQKKPTLTTRVGQRCAKLRGLVSAGAADGVDRGNFQVAVLGVIFFCASVGGSVFGVFLHVMQFLMGDDASGGHSLADVFG